jgi:hypothetical protein
MIQGIQAKKSKISAEFDENGIFFTKTYCPPQKCQKNIEKL